MVDVSDKAITQRVARASGKIKFSSDIAMEQIAANTNKKGDVLSTARIAGILGVKRTCDLIPLCHNIFISKVSISFQAADNSIEATCQVKCQGKTGVEMEALTGVSISLLTIYDMCKAVDKGMAIADIKVVEKIGGKSGSWKLED